MEARVYIESIYVSTRAEFGTFRRRAPARRASLTYRSRHANLERRLPVVKGVEVPVDVGAHSIRGAEDAEVAFTQDVRLEAE